MTSKATVSSLVCLVLALFACDAGPAPAPSPEPVAVEEADSPAEAPAPGVPKISAEAVHEFGAIKASDSVEHVFKIRNEGTAELVIEKVHKTWGCTATVLSEDRIPPGGEGEIKVTLRPKGNHPEITKRIVVESNDPEQPKFTLTMKGRLLVDWVAKPAVVSMPSLRLNEAGKATFSLERSPDSNAEISSAKITDTDNFTLKRIDDSAEGNPTYEVGFRGRDSVGHQSTQIFIETTGENTPALTIQVQARASLNLSYAKRVRFSRKDGEIQPRVYRLSARNGEAPTIKKVVDRDGLLDITVLEPRGAMASLELTVKPEVFAALDHDAQIGPHTLVIHTDDRDEKKIEIEYQVSPERPISARSAPRPPVEGTVSPTTAPVPPATANPH